MLEMTFVSELYAEQSAIPEDDYILKSVVDQIQCFNYKTRNFEGIGPVFLIIECRLPATVCYLAFSVMNLPLCVFGL